MTETDISGLGGLVVDIDADDVPEFVAPTTTVKLGGDIYTASFPDDAFVVEMLEAGAAPEESNHVMKYLWRVYESSLNAEEFERLKDNFGKTVTLRKFISAAQKLIAQWEPYVDSYFAELVDSKPTKTGANRAARRSTRKK